MKKILLATILFALASCQPVFALDGSASVEIDTHAGHTASDVQVQVGQALGDSRLFVAGEWTNPSEFFPNSPRNYRAGVQYNVTPSVVVESGLGDYCDSLYYYAKGTISFDTAVKR